MPDGQGDLSKAVGPDLRVHLRGVSRAQLPRALRRVLKARFSSSAADRQAAPFPKLSETWHKLIGLHLMKSRGAETTRYPVNGLNVVERPRYQAPKNGESGRVWINGLAVLRGCTAGGLELLCGRVSGVRKVAERPPRA